jgi:predicted RNA-binding protein with RPS1 domain
MSRHNTNGMPHILQTKQQRVKDNHDTLAVRDLFKIKIVL